MCNFGRIKHAAIQRGVEAANLQDLGWVHQLIVFL